MSSQHNIISSLAHALGLEGIVHVQQLALEGGATASTTAVCQLLQELGGGTQARQVVAHVSVEIRKTSKVASKGTRGYCVGQSGISRGLCQNVGGRVVAAAVVVVQYNSIASAIPGVAVAAAVASLACVVASTLVPIAIAAPLSMILLLLKLLKLLLLLNLLRQVIQRQIQNGGVLVGYIPRCYQTQKVFDAGGASYVEAVRIPECRQSRRRIVGPLQEIGEGDSTGVVSMQEAAHAGATATAVVHAVDQILEVGGGGLSKRVAAAATVATAGVVVAVVIAAAITIAAAAAVTASVIGVGGFVAESRSAHVVGTG